MTSPPVQVSIIIPTYHQVAWTRKCLESIRNTPTSIAYEIIMVDNFSTDGTREYLENTPGLELIFNSRNLGFARACNQGAARARGKHLLFLNNDTQVTPNWMEPLVEIITAHEHVGAVGARLLFADGRIQHAGVVIIRQAEKVSLLPRHIFAGESSNIQWTNTPLYFQAVTAACVLVEKSVFQEVGGFDEQYWNGSEDVDFCFKLLQLGKKIVYQPASVVYHHESKSGYERLLGQPANNRLLRERWGAIIQPDIVEEDTFVRKGPARAISTFPDQGNHEACIQAMVTWWAAKNNKSDREIPAKTPVTALPETGIHLFWNIFTYPVLKAIDARRIVEIGTGNGKTTRKLLDFCRECDGFLDTMDIELVEEIVSLIETFPGHARFHASTSLNVLPMIDEMDAVLVDGDPNWFTVYSELKLIEKKALKGNFSFPLVLVHNVAWPYARRDLYYAPENISPAYLKLYGSGGLKMDVSELIDGGGLNAGCNHSIYHNDFQNGVLTAVEDFIRESDLNLKLLILPVMHGLGVLYPEEMTNNSEFEKLIQLFSFSSPQKDFLTWIERQRLELLEKASEKELGEKFNKYDLHSQNQHFQVICQNMLKEIAKGKEALEQSSAERHDDIQKLNKCRKWLNQLNHDFKDLMSSYRWKVGHSLMRMAEILLFRSKQPMVVDHMREIFKAFQDEKFQMFPEKTGERRRTYTRQTLKELRKSHGGHNILKNEPVTIIIPVFNALSETLECLKSVVANRVVAYDVIVMDDCSDQAGISEILSQYCAKYPFISYHRNTSNLGYTQNINKGIGLVPTGDVILLNSDTIVTGGWVEKMAAAAYSQEKVATVTPLSNAAGAFSIPKQNEDNVIPDYACPEVYNQALEMLSKRKRPVVPTGNGFCMYITRAALNKLRAFDAEHFPRGYGEENDFCQRAIQEGFVNLIDDSTFIFHYRSSSFGPEKQAMVENAKKQLALLHPGYKQSVTRWLEDDSLRDLRDQFAKKVSAPNFSATVRKHRTILYVLHDGEGGVMHTTNDLAKHVSINFTVLILRCNKNYWSLWSHSKGHNGLIELYPFVQPWTVMDRMGTARQKVLDSILNRHAPSLIHIRHFIGSEPEIVSCFKQCALPVIVSLHDMYVACPTIQLIDNHGRYCGGSCTDGDGICPLSRTWFENGVPDLKHKRVYEYRARFAKQLALADMLITTSKYTRDTLVEIFPNLNQSRFPVIEHGRSINRYALQHIPDENEKIPVVSFGALGHSKGVELLEYLVKKNHDTGSRFIFHFLGTGLGETSGMAQFGAVAHGPYAREELPKKIRTIAPAFALILSTWPETYCHTLTEAWAMGLPVVASNIGALKERIEKHGGGWLVDFRDPEKCWSQLLEITSDRTSFMEVSQEVEKIQIRSEADMARDYLKLYQELLPIISMEVPYSVISENNPHLQENPN